MTSNEFKRCVYKTLRPKTAKEGLKSFAGKQRTVNLVDSVFSTRVSVDALLSEFQGYLLGFQMKEPMKAKALPAVGNVLHAAANVSKLLKSKVPPSQRKIKPKDTPAFLLTEINKMAGDMLATVYASVNAAAVVALNEEEQKVENEKFAAAQAKAAEKAKASPEAKAAPTAKAPRSTKVVPGVIDTDKLAKEVQTLLNLIYTFVWAVYNRPVADVMEAHIKEITPKYPEGFFTPPPKKPAPNTLPPKAAAAHAKKAEEAKAPAA